MHKILFYGPFGGKQGKHIGGGESGNRRTRKLLEDMGVTVYTLEKPYLPSNKFAKIIAYPFLMLLIFVKMIYLILTKRIDKVHVAGFYGNLVYFEFFFILLSRMMRRPVVYELRAGGVLDFYNTRGRIYKLFFRSCLRIASYVLSQGRAQIGELTHISGNENILYFPNFVSGVFADFINEPDVRSSQDVISIIYFGRIGKTKNVDFIVKACSFLDFSFRLKIIGSGDFEYLQYLGGVIRDLSLDDRVEILPAAEQGELKKDLRGAHFFIFPSEEPREGHSNALTEAMSQGVVPIASNVGFNADVISMDELVISKLEPQEYADAVNHIWQSAAWLKFSCRCRLRVAENYTQLNVEEVLRQAHFLSN